MSTLAWEAVVERGHPMSAPLAPGVDSSYHDRQSLELLARGDTAPIADLYDRYGAVVFSLIVNIVGDTGVAEELVQDVFIRVWRSAASYRPELGSVRAWLLAIAHHCAVDEWRRRRKEEGWVSLESIGTEWLPTNEDNSGDPFVSRALAELPDEQRRVLELAYFHGFTVSDIARRLGLAPGTVKSRIRLGMIKLRARLGVTREHKP